VDQLGPNALGEVLEAGRVTDCYLGLLLPPGPAGEPEAGTVLVVAPAALLHPRVPQSAGRLVLALLTGHPEREPAEVVFVADLTVELRIWPNDTWTARRGGHAGPTPTAPHVPEPEPSPSGCPPTVNSPGCRTPPRTRTPRRRRRRWPSCGTGAGPPTVAAARVADTWCPPRNRLRSGDELLRAATIALAGRGGLTRDGLVAGRTGGTDEGR
jgi:hypothetical protein